LTLKAAYLRDGKEEKNMYSFREIDKETVNKFNMEDPKGHIFQTSYWADVKTEWSSAYIGGFDGDGKLVLSSMMLIRKIPYIGSYMGYIPRGFTCDYTNTTLVEEFTAFLRDFSKKKKIAFVTVDPDIHLMEDQKNLEQGMAAVALFEKLGYMNKKAANFENIQPNFVFRLPLETEGDKEEIKKRTFNSFENKTRYNIKVAMERGLQVEVYDKDNITEEAIDTFQNLMNITGIRDRFITRPKQYFKNMVEDIAPYCRLYLVKYSYEKDFARISEKLATQEKTLEKMEKKKADFIKQLESLPQDADEGTRHKAEKKLKDAESGAAEAERQIKGFQTRIQEIEEFKGKEVYVSGAIYIYYGRIGWYFYGASHNILRDTMPNFLMQWSMIQDSIDLGCSVYDFRGVSGDLNPDNHLYGLYKFKKGFNGKFVEFIGEFELIINSGVYKLFNFVLPKFKNIRVALRRRK
jgi:peptidoglycan pentaglycine glycine transferase (the first glycine)